MQTPDTVAIINDLQAQLDELRREVTLLRSAGRPANRDPEDGIAATASRRGLLKLAGATAAGVVASTAIAARAAADTGYTTGGSTTVGDVVRQQLNGTRASEIGFLFATNSSPALTSNDSAYGSALAGWSIDGTTAAGVYGHSNAGGGYGIIGVATGSGGTGVLAQSNAVGVSATGTTVGVRGSSAGGVGGWFSGDAGALRVTDDRTGPPTERNVTHSFGVIQADALGDLWFCYKGGRPGSWRKITGRSTAGAFHAITPGRVYDSRVAQPAPGAIAGGQTRTISVASGRNTTTGAVTVTDFVPAGATAIAANVTVASVAGGGFLACNPGGTTEVTASTINWTAPGQVLANGVILALDDRRRLTVVAGGGTTHFVVDVTGYWL